MAGPKGGNQLARRVIDDPINFSGKTSVRGYMKFFLAQQIFDTRRFLNRMHEEAQTSRNLIAQLNALIAEMEALEDREEMFDTLMGLRDDRRVENTKLEGLTDLITQAEEEIEMKEAKMEVMDG
uniref:Uncharacterized protein n=1 Tax=Tanacetum cinerariifolium TaxID=118510 RepID=A0A6L2MBW3_TANCI|nr:hypothetical protein [Tanacetum cinerariifolium]